jgi:hypothetical protein
MIDWYVEISEWSPESFKKDDYIQTVIETATPFMEHFCRRLEALKDWKLEDANKIFSEIIEEWPIMRPSVWNEEFSIHYNKWVFIKLTDTTKEIYRDSKIRQILA